MALIGSGRFLATAVSGLAAVAILSLAGWMLLGGGDAAQSDGAVRIIPPAAAFSSDNATGAESAGAKSNDAKPTNAGGSEPEATPSADSTVHDQIEVYVTGAVVNPGVYATTAGQRLNAVLAMAGGPTQDADLNRVNLAAYVTDAAHYRIPAVADTAGAANAAASAAAITEAPAVEEPAAVACAVPVDINAATADCLETLPGIGGVRADAIVAYREQAGPFLSADGITAVSGIGSGIYGRIAQLITVSPR